MDNQRRDQDDQHQRKQIVKRQVLGLNASRQGEKDFHGGLQGEQKKGGLPSRGPVVQQQAEPLPVPQPVKQQGGGGAGAQKQPQRCHKLGVLIRYPERKGGDGHLKNSRHTGGGERFPDPPLPCPAYPYRTHDENGGGTDEIPGDSQYRDHLQSDGEQQRKEGRGEQEWQLFQPLPHRFFVRHRQQIGRQDQMRRQGVQKSTENIIQGRHDWDRSLSIQSCFPAIL